MIYGIFRELFNQHRFNDLWYLRALSFKHCDTRADIVFMAATVVNVCKVAATKVLSPRSDSVSFELSVWMDRWDSDTLYLQVMEPIDVNLLWLISPSKNGVESSHVQAST